MLEIKLSMCLHVCMHAYVQTQVISLSSMLRIYYAKFLTEQLLSQTVMKLLITNLICIIPRNKKNCDDSHCVSCVFVQSSPVV